MTQHTISHTTDGTITSILLGTVSGILGSTAFGTTSSITLSLLFQPLVDGLQYKTVDRDGRSVGLLLGLGLDTACVTRFRQLTELAGVEPKRKAPSWMNWLTSFLGSFMGGGG
jgi:hypothetical protein